jgi:transposase
MKAIKESPNEEIKPRRRYDEAFKRGAIELWRKSGRSARAVASELGISDRHLYGWRREYDRAQPVSPGQMEKELAALRQENAYLREQRDILKKTLGILSEPPKNATNGSES